jgi:outer membrane protein insertion porin family
VRTGFLLVPLIVLTLFGFPGAAQNSSQKELPKTAPQVQEVLPSYEGQNVVSLELAGRPGLDPAKLLHLLAQREGQPFDQGKIDESISRLKQSGVAKEIQVEVRPEAQGVRVLFVLQPAFYFGIYEFPGAQHFAYSRLVQVADYPPRGAYAASDVKNTQIALVNFFQKYGYFRARVQPELITDPDHLVVNVTYHVTLNRHARFGKVVFSGVPAQEEQRLQGALKSWIARLRGEAIRSGKSYSSGTVQKATQYLETQLMKRGYLASQVKLAGADYVPETNLADVHFDVSTGPLVHVKIVGAHIGGGTRQKLLPIYQQSGLDPELIQEGRQNLISYFQAKGYFSAAVQSDVQDSSNSKTVIYRITKGARHKVAEVQIAGNHSLPAKQVQGQIQVQEGHFFSHGKYSEQLARKSASNLKNLYQADGFSSVQVTPKVALKGGDLAVTFLIDEGPRDIVEALQVAGNTTVPESQLAPQGLKLTIGGPYSSQRVNEDRNHILAQYLRMGYLNADFRAVAHLAGKDPHRLAVTYTISEGPRVITESVIILGARATRPSLIRHAATLKKGAPLREDELFAAESRLYQLGIFDWAEIDPRRPITTQDKEDVVLKVHESKENEIQYGFGFEVINRGGNIPSGTVALPGLPPVGLPSTFKTSEKTFWGPRGTFQYTRRNFRGLGESLAIGLLGARLIQKASASYSDPYFLGGNWTSDISLSVSRDSENPIFTSRIGDFGFQVQRYLNAAKTKNLFLRYGLRQTVLSNLLIPDLVPSEDRRVRLSTLSATYSQDTRDNVLDAHKGMYRTLEFDINPGVLGSSVSFARLQGQLAYYKNIGAGIIWANSLRLGLEQSFASSHVPVSELFFSGGGSTLRGFPLNGAGPQHTIPVCSDPANPSTCTQIQVPLGGRQLFIINSEFRIPVPLKKGLGVVGFYDGGNVYQHVGFRDFASNYTNTIGVGIRYQTPVGPVRIDLGHNLNPVPGIKSTQYFITLGQAF